MSRVRISTTLKSPKEVNYSNSNVSKPQGYKESYPFSKLMPSHSVFIPGKTPYDLRHDIYPSAEKLGYELTARQGENSRGTPGTNVWRTA